MVDISTPIKGQSWLKLLNVLKTICVYSRSDKHLISKMEKPKVAKPKLELFGESLLTFFFFPNCLFVFSEQFSSFHIFPHFTPQVVGGGFPPILVQWTAFTLPLHPFSPPLLSKAFLFFPLCRGGFFHLLSPLSEVYLFPFFRMGTFPLPSPKPG